MAAEGITGIIEDLDDLATAGGAVSAGQVMERLGHRGTGVFLFVPGLLGISPLSVVPTVPSLLAVIVLTFSVQIALGRNKMWLPGFLRNRSVDDDKLHAAAQKMMGLATWLDRNFGNRLPALTGRLANRAAAALCIVLAAMVPPLELLPLASALPLGAIAALGLALVLGDGVVMLLALAASAGALYGIWSFLT